jgi:hypothetical protein
MERQMKPLTLGTGHILPTKTGVLLRYMTAGSFIVGERLYSTEQAAREFCEARGIRVL